MMKIRSALFATALMCFGGQAMANDCEFTIESNDAMQFNHKEMTVSKSCESYKVILKHVGKLPKNVMGHNWALSKTADVAGVIGDGAKAGLDNHYIKPGDERVIAATPMIGGGETTEVTFDVSKLEAGTEYTFFCSFPGHYGLMRGKLLLK